MEVCYSANGTEPGTPVETFDAPSHRRSIPCGESFITHGQEASTMHRTPRRKRSGLVVAEQVACASDEQSLSRGGRYHRQDASVTTIVLLGTARYSSEQDAAQEKKDCWKWKHLACRREIRQRRLEAARQWTTSTVINQIVAGNSGIF